MSLFRKRAAAVHYACKWPFFCLLTAVWLVACQSNPATPTSTRENIEVTLLTPAVTSSPISTIPTATAEPPTSGPTLMESTAVPPTLTPPISLPTTTPFHHPLAAYTLSAYRQQSFSGGSVQIRSTAAENTAFTQYYIDYPSNGLTITGMMHVPKGTGPHPVILLLHGYYDRQAYFAGAGTWQAAEYFAQQGFLTIAPDFRSWGESDWGLSLFHMGLTADVLHLTSSLASIPEADASRVGLWGHSMGGGITTKVLTIDSRIQAAVLYAPNSADDADLIGRWGAGCLAGQSEGAGDQCNPAEIIPSDTPADIAAAYREAAADPAFLQQVSPLYHLEYISAPIQIHIGTADGASLAQTPPEWSAKLADALKEVEKDVEYYVYEGQGHFFNGQSWTLMMERAVSHFNIYLK